MRRGTVYWISFEPSAPPEVGKVRPGVIVPLSTLAPEIWPLRIEVRSKGLKPSYAADGAGR